MPKFLRRLFTAGDECLLIVGAVLFDDAVEGHSERYRAVGDCRFALSIDDVGEHFVFFRSEYLLH